MYGKLVEPLYFSPGGSGGGFSLAGKSPPGPGCPAKRRDKLHIIAEILDTAGRGIFKTQIMYKCNLSFTQLNEYLNFMLKVDLLEKNDTDGNKVYIASKKGLYFLQRYMEINELMKPPEKDEGFNTRVKVPPTHLLRKPYTSSKKK